MGIYHTNKCLLLDEQDFTPGGFDPKLNLDDLVEYASEQAGDLAGTDDEMDGGPLIEVLGVVSERFNAFCLESDDCDPSFVQESWRATLHKVGTCLANVDADTMNLFLDTGDVDTLEKVQKALLFEAVEADRYFVAEELIDGLKGLAASGLPGFVSDMEMTCGGDDAAYDVRQGKYAPGTRVVVEYAVFWP